MVAAPSVPIDQRFAQLIQQFGLTKNSFAISLGKTASVVQHLIDGRNKPGYDLLCKVFEIYPNVSRDWLLLGRGPMLVSGEPVPKPALPVASRVQEPPLEPIDISDLEVPVSRRTGVGAARLQPNEIAATLVLAAVASQPARTATAAPHFSPTATSAASTTAAGLAADVAPAAAESATVQPLGTGFAPFAAPPAAAAPIAAEHPAPVPTPVAAPAPVTAPASGPEAYVAAALHAQHLQHQLALSELRNQHLLEQQQMLREMLAMARQAMV